MLMYELYALPLYAHQTKVVMNHNRNVGKAWQRSEKRDTFYSAVKPSSQECEPQEGGLDGTPP